MDSDLDMSRVGNHRSYVLVQRVPGKIQCGDSGSNHLISNSLMQLLEPGVSLPRRLFPNVVWAISQIYTLGTSRTKADSPKYGSSKAKADEAN